MARTGARSGQRRSERKIPRSCSDVYRLWASVGLGALLALLFEIGLDVVESLGLRQQPTAVQLAVQQDFGANLIAWLGFAVAYLVLGIRAFAGCSRPELVRRVLGTPLPTSRVRLWLLAGGGGIGWPLLIALVAFSTVVTAVLERDNAPALVLVLAALSILTCLSVIVFSFALHYARKDIERGGLDFTGDDQPTFSDYVYLSIGVSATFGTTDTSVTTGEMRRTVSVHSVMAWILNTVVVAVLLSVIVS